MTAIQMSETELIERFESGELVPSDFPHAEHVRLAWALLGRVSPLEALTRFAEGLKRFTIQVGLPQKYHETITWAYLLIIHERRSRDPDADWRTFRVGNPDLFEPWDQFLARWYDRATLESERARRSFVFPRPR